jgi:hypothetical protein
MQVPVAQDKLDQNPDSAPQGNEWLPQNPQLLHFHSQDFYRRQQLWQETLLDQ